MSLLRESVSKDWLNRFETKDPKQIIQGDLLLGQELQYYVAWFCQRIHIMLTPKSRSGFSSMWEDPRPPTHNMASIKRSLGRPYTSDEPVDDLSFHDLLFM